MPVLTQSTNAHIQNLSSINVNTLISHLKPSTPIKGVLPLGAAIYHCAPLLSGLMLCMCGDVCLAENAQSRICIY